MRRDIRGAVLLTLSLCLLAATGAVALRAISYYGGPPVRRGLVSARLDSTTDDGVLQLHTLEIVRLAARNAPLTVPAGTTLHAPATMLTPVGSVAPVAPPGSKLRCELRARFDADVDPHIEVVRCSVGSPDERQ